MSARFEAELKKRIAEEIERVRDELDAGLAVKDYAQYQNRVGRLTALKAVVNDYCAEVETIINKD